MGYFDEKKNVQEYIRMADGFDGAEFVEKLTTVLPEGSTVLELGMGPGKDLDMLMQKYKATGSDSSTVFIESYRELHPEADLIHLDAAAMNTDRTFQGIYSNKVLHHLTTADLKRSFENQFQCLEPGGIALHTFWNGDGEEDYDGLRFVYYRIEELTTLLPPGFQILGKSVYTEMAKDDSICLILRKG